MVDACVQYKTTCTSLHDTLTKLHQRAAPEKELVEECMFYFALLKKYNCKAQQQCKRVRDNTHQLKKKLDSTDLVLKNINFEETYLQREMQKCIQYRSVDETLSLIPESEFVSSAGDVPKEPHERMVKRLNWELEQRKAMKVELEGWEKSKLGLEKEIDTLKDYLATLPPQLDEMLNTTTQVQEYLGLKLVHRKTQSDMMAWLPQQLYNIYSQVTGYSEFADLGTTVTINGDLENAKNFSTTSNSDIDEVIEVETKHSKRRSAALDPGKKRVFKTHPLTVEVIVPCDAGVHAKVQFNYLVKLKVVTVTISLMITTGSPWRDKFSVGTDYMSSKELLCALWPGDHGDECPNPEMSAILNKYSLPSKAKIPNNIGRPFLWAQRLAGVTGWGVGSELDVGVSRETVSPFLEAIKQRCLARLSLKYQLRNLNASKLVSEGSLPRPTLLTELASWKELQLEDLVEGYPARARGLVSDKDTYYEIVVKRGKTSCTGTIVLSLDYPVTPPFTLLNIATPNGTLTGLNDPNTRAIEEELNIHISSLYLHKKEYILTKIVSKLCMCVDVLVEGLGLEPQIKFFINKFSGPDNILPYVFNADKQYFQHR